jgi:hypothetical protein
MPVSTPTARHVLRLLLALGIAAYGFVRVTKPEHWDLLDDVNLAIHEAGHVLFQPFGDPLVVLGGSLFQVMVPVAFVAYFLVRREPYSASIVAAWVGVSLTNVALYISDARAQELPLLGGENVIHDWWYLLIEWDLLSADLVIARWVRLAGALAFVVSVAGGIAFAREARNPTSPQAGSRADSRVSSGRSGRP